MAELVDEEEVIDTVEEIVENNEISEEETPFDDEDTELLKKYGINPEEATIDDLKKLAKRVLKAEKVIVENKKQAKVAPKSTEDVRAILAEEKFYDKNPEAEAYRKDIEKYVGKGIDRDEALFLVTRKDKEVEKTREVYGKPLIGGSNNDGMSVITMESFDNMTPQAQEEYIKKMTSKYGKIKFK